MINCKTPKIKSFMSFPELVIPLVIPLSLKSFGGVSFIRHLSSGTADFSENLYGLPLCLVGQGGKENYFALNNTRDHFRGGYLFSDSGDRLLQPLVCDAFGVEGALSVNSATLIVSGTSDFSSVMHARESSKGNSAPCEDRRHADGGSSISALISILEGTWQGLGDDDAVAVSASMSILIQKSPSTQD